MMPSGESGTKILFVCLGIVLRVQAGIVISGWIYLFVGYTIDHGNPLLIKLSDNVANGF
jgi:hypothetical protein